MKIKIKFFILGFLSCLILSGIIIGGIFIVNDLNKNNNNDNNNNKEKEGTVVDGYRYIEEKRSDDNENNITCTMLNNVKQYAYSYDEAFFITNDNDLYIINKNQKFSDTNENCHKYTDKKIKNIIVYGNGGDAITFVDENDIRYYASHEKKDLETYIGYPEFVNTDILWYYDNGTEQIENNNYLYKKIVLEPDGKLYNYKTKWKNDKYIIESKELEYEIENEKIVKVDMDYDNNFNTRFIKNIYTDKGVYYSINTNPECQEYADIKCEYKLEKEKYFSTKVDDAVYYYGLYNSKDEDGEYITRFEYLNKDGKRVLIRKEKNSD